MNLPLVQQYSALLPGDLKPVSSGVVDERGWVWCDTCGKWWHPESEHAVMLRGGFAEC